MSDAIDRDVECFRQSVEAEAVARGIERTAAWQGRLEDALRCELAARRAEREMRTATSLTPEERLVRAKPIIDWSCRRDSILAELLPEQVTMSTLEIMPAIDPTGDDAIDAAVQRFERRLRDLLPDPDPLAATLAWCAASSHACGLVLAGMPDCEGEVADCYARRDGLLHQLGIEVADVL